MNRLENEYMEMALSDGIVFCRYKPGFHIDIDIAHSIVADRVKLCAGKTYPLLVDMREVKSASKDARDYFASDEGMKNLNSGAFLVGNQVSKFLGNIFISLNSPVLPAKLFTEKSKALKWLEKFKE